jgi:glycosyltransferase involved in cell wall biosynthesis
MTNTHLTIAMATVGDRLPRLRPTDLPSVEGAIWHLFVQGEPMTIATESIRLRRDDVIVTHSEGRGAARNRNAALKAAQTELLLFSDDDLSVDPSAIEQLIQRFLAMPDMDFICARLSDESGKPRKRYSDNGTRARWFNCGKVGTPELAVRPSRMRAKNVWFDVSFGAGTDTFLGDEYIFLCDALRAGLRGVHVDLTLAQHPAESSGTQSGPAVMAVRRLVLIRALGRWVSLPIRLGFVFRHRKGLRLHDILQFLRP